MLEISKYRYKYCIFLLIIVSFIPVYYNFDLGLNTSSSPVVTVEIEHYGVPATIIEESIAIPTENALYTINTVSNVKSKSEFGKVRFTVYPNINTDLTEFFLDIRNRIDTIYQQFPSSVQKPRISISKDDNKPVLILGFKPSLNSSVEEVRSIVDLNIKPSVEKIEGVGNVVVNGGKIKEVKLTVDNNTINSRKIDISFFQQALSSINEIASVGPLSNGQTNFPVTYDSRIDKLEGFNNIIFKDIAFNSLSQANYAFRSPDTISKYNGQNIVSVYIYDNGLINILSFAKKVLSIDFKNSKYDFSLIYNKSESISKAIINITISVVICYILIFFFILFYYRSLSTAFFILFINLISIYFTVSILCVLNITIDEYILTGIGIGTGLITDTGIVIIETRYFRNYSKSTVTSLLFSLLTSLIVLFALTLTSKSGYTYYFSIALIIYFTISFLAYIFIFNFFFNSDTISINNIKSIPIINIKLPLVFVFISIITILFLINAFLIKFDSSTSENDKTFFCQIELPSNSSIQHTEEMTNRITNKLLNAKGVKDIISVIHHSSSNLTIRYETDSDSIENQIKVLNENNNSSYYIFDNSSSKKQTTEIPIYISGDETLKMREYIKNFANSFQDSHPYETTIFHFKEDKKAYIIKPNSPLLATSGISFVEIARFFNYYIHNPVVKKWKPDSEKKEYDIRLAPTNYHNPKDMNSFIKNLDRVSFKNYMISNLFLIENSSIDNAIYREGKRRCLYATLQFDDLGIRKALDITRNKIDHFDLPYNYYIKLTKSATDSMDVLSLQLYIFLTCIFLVFAVLVLYYNSFKYALFSMSIIPLTYFLSLPFINMFYNYINLTIIAGSIVSIGLIVNNSILLMNSYFEGGIHHSNKHFYTIINGFITSLLAAIPILFFTDITSFSHVFTIIYLIILFSSLVVSYFIFIQILKYLNRAC